MKKKTILIILITVVLLLVAFAVADYFALSNPSTKQIEVRKVKTE